MILDLTQYRFFLKPGATDMRKGIGGLSVIAQNVMKQDLFAKCLFLFTNRDRKILYWNRNGFCLWTKALQKDRFPWPDSEELARQIQLDQLKLLLDGIDFFKVHKELPYSRV